MVDNAAKTIPWRWQEIKVLLDQDFQASQFERFVGIERFGSDPRLLIHEGALYAQGATRSLAQAACDLAADGAFVLRLTEAFGGANFMSEKQWQFVVDWEAESYRQSVAESY